MKPLGERGADGREGGVDERPWAAIAQGVLIFPCAPANVERRDGRAGPGDPETEFGMAILAQTQRRDAMPGFRIALARRASLSARVLEHDGCLVGTE